MSSNPPSIRPSFLPEPSSLPPSPSPVMSGGETTSFFVPFQLICCVDVWQVTSQEELAGRVVHITRLARPAKLLHGALSLFRQVQLEGGDLRPQQETSSAAETRKESGRAMRNGMRAASGLDRPNSSLTARARRHQTEMRSA